MKKILKIKHITNYSYDRKTSLGPQCIRLKPSKSNLYSISNYDLKISPKPSSIEWFTDIYGNCIASAIFQNPTNELIIEVNMQIEFHNFSNHNLTLSLESKNYPFFILIMIEKKFIHIYVLLNQLNYLKIIVIN